MQPFCFSTRGLGEIGPTYAPLSFPPLPRLHMTSERQVAANRRNASLSTGPRTAAGKAVVAQNALRHGMLSRQVSSPARVRPISSSSGNACESVWRRSMSWRCCSSTASSTSSSAWRLRRVLQAEADLMASEQSTAGRLPRLHRQVLERNSRYETTLERGLYRALGLGGPCSRSGGQGGGDPDSATVVS